jgi:hypothetical protein
MIFRTLSDLTTAGRDGGSALEVDHHQWMERTFIFPDVLQSKGQTSILPLDYANLAKGTSTDDSEKTEVIEVDCQREPWLAMHQI